MYGKQMEVVAMGRYVWSIGSLIDFSWKFAFAEQPSDFGELLKLACPDFVNRYTSWAGEVVHVYGPPQEIVKGVEEYIKTYDLPDYDVEMLREFAEAVKKAPTDEFGDIEGWFYVEY